LSVDVSRDTLPDLIRVTHTLKGICGTVGAIGARDQAGQVNHALLALDADDTVTLNKVRADLQGFVTAMRTMATAVLTHSIQEQAGKGV